VLPTVTRQSRRDSRAVGRSSYSDIGRSHDDQSATYRSRGHGAVRRCRLQRADLALRTSDPGQRGIARGALPRRVPVLDSPVLGRRSLGRRPARFLCPVPPHSEFQQLLEPGLARADHHSVFAMGWRQSCPVRRELPHLDHRRFRLDGTNIANYTTNFYVGTSHRDLLYVWPGGLWWSGGWTECTVAHPGNLNHPASSASGPNFTFGTSGSDPFLPAPIPLFGQLWGSFSGTNLTLTWSTGQFPSFGVRVQGPFGSYTKTVNDAWGLGSDVSSPTFLPIIAGKLNCWVVSCNTSSVTIPVAPPPAPSGNTIYPGQALIQNTSQSTLWSSDGRFFVVMQGDGNFCLYWNGVRVLWCAPGTYHHGYEAIMQGDGNFAIYDAGGAYVWGTYNGNIRAVQPGSYITMQNDGNFVEYGSTGASWASNTCCH